MSQSAPSTTERRPSGREWPSITVNVLAYNRRDEVRRTLQAVCSELDYPSDRLEVVVVDNASQDGTGDMVRHEFPSVALISRAHNIGVSGWNDGFRAGRGDFFLVLDDDCYVAGDALKVAVAGALEEDADLVSFRVLSPEYADVAFSDLYRTGLLSFWGCSALISRRAIETVGGFDPKIFVWAHEMEFTARVLDAGFRHLYLPEVASTHLKRMAPSTSRSYAFHLRNLAYFAAKALRPTDSVGAIANLMARAAINSAKRPGDARELIGAVGGGAWLGSRHRAPLRPNVSRTYRRDFQEFINPTRIMRSAGERLRPATANGGPEIPASEMYSVRALAFFDRRPELYPRERASLRL